MAQMMRATNRPRSGLGIMTVLDVATGDEVDLASLAPSDGPILLWMWAPH